MFPLKLIAEILHASYSCKKFSPVPYQLAGVHPLQTDGQMTTMPVAQPLFYIWSAKNQMCLKC